MLVGEGRWGIISALSFNDGLTFFGALTLPIKTQYFLEIWFQLSEDRLIDLLCREEALSQIFNDKDKNKTNTKAIPPLTSSRTEIQIVCNY